LLPPVVASGYESELAGSKLVPNAIAKLLALTIRYRSNCPSKKVPVGLLKVVFSVSVIVAMSVISALTAVRLLLLVTATILFKKLLLIFPPESVATILSASVAPDELAIADKS
jgi:hypothetical protein